MESQPNFKTCPHCGKGTDPFCSYCGHLLDPTSTTDTAEETESTDTKKKNNNRKGSSSMNNKKNQKNPWINVLIIGMVLVFALILTDQLVRWFKPNGSTSDVSIGTPVITVAPAPVITATPVPTATPMPTITPAPVETAVITVAPAPVITATPVPVNTSGYVSNYEQFAISNGTVNADQNIYQKPYEAGVMVTNDAKQTVWYAQSGKTGTITLHGFIPAGQILAIDANILQLPNEPTYKNGAIKFLAGPLNLEKYQITLTNGAAQLVKPQFAQAFLDYNMAVKFARGNWDNQKGKFSYRPWDLQADQIWVLDYTYNSLVGHLNADNDTYPR